MRHAAGQALPPMQPFKPKEDTSLPWTALEQVARAQIEWLQEVTKAVVAHGGKTAREINAINFPDLKVEPNITPGTVPTPAQYFTPFTGFLASTPAEPKLVKYRIIRTGYNQTEDVAAHLVEGYASLFEACWRGDIHTIERLCLPPKSGKKSKDATYLQIAAEIVPSKIGLFISRSDLCTYHCSRSSSHQTNFVQHSPLFPSRSWRSNGMRQKPFSQLPRHNTKSQRT